MTELRCFRPILCIKAGGFLNLKNDMRELCFERMDVILTNYGHESYMFFTEWTVFLQKMAMRWEHSFFHDNREKSASYWLFWPIIEYSFNRVGVFLTNMWMTKGGFSWKVWKKTSLEHRISERLDVFLTKYGHESYVFFRDWTFFGQKMGERALILSWKVVEKGHPTDFFGP